MITDPIDERELRNRSNMSRSIFADRWDWDRLKFKGLHRYPFLVEHVSPILGIRPKTNSPSGKRYAY